MFEIITMQKNYNNQIVIKKYKFENIISGRILIIEAENEEKAKIILNTEYSIVTSRHKFIGELK